MYDVKHKNKNSETIPSRFFFVNGKQWSLLFYVICVEYTKFWPNNFSLILRSTCYFSRVLHEAAELKTTYIQIKTQEFVGEWLERNNLQKLKSVFESIF